MLPSLSHDPGKGLHLSGEWVFFLSGTKTADELANSAYLHQNAILQYFKIHSQKIISCRNHLGREH